jgi:hypothetical protein
MVDTNINIADRGELHKLSVEVYEKDLELLGEVFEESGNFKPMFAKDKMLIGLMANILRAKSKKDAEEEDEGDADTTV